MSAFDNKYPIPPQFSSDFTPDEASDMRKAFQVFDVNGDGHIDDQELKQILENLGEKVSVDALQKMVQEVDIDGNHEIDWNEFCTMMHNIHNGTGAAALGQVVKKAAKMFNIEGAGGALHTFSEDEKHAFTMHLNNCLKKDEHLADRMPLNPDSMDLFEKCDDGLMLCKLINLAEEGSIDERALNKKKNMNVYQKVRGPKRRYEASEDREKEQARSEHDEKKWERSE